MKEHILDFSQLSGASLPKVGGKNINLGGMLNARIAGDLSGASFAGRWNAGEDSRLSQGINKRRN